MRPHARLISFLQEVIGKKENAVTSSDLASPFKRNIFSPTSPWYDVFCRNTSREQVIDLGSITTKLLVFHPPRVIPVWKQFHYSWQYSSLTFPHTREAARVIWPVLTWPLFVCSPSPLRCGRSVGGGEGGGGDVTRVWPDDTEWGPPFSPRAAVRCGQEPLTSAPQNQRRTQDRECEGGGAQICMLISVTTLGDNLVSCAFDFKL